MTITDQRIVQLAREAVTGAIQGLAANAVGLGERLYDEPGVDEFGEAEFAALCERLGAAIRRYLPVRVPATVDLGSQISVASGLGTGITYSTRWEEKGVLAEGSPWQDGGQLS